MISFRSAGNILPVLGIIMLLGSAFISQSAQAESVPDPSGDIIGRILRDENGEDLGRIIETVKSREGKIVYILLVPEEQSASEESFVPIPWRLVATGKEGDALMASFSRKKLQNAPRVKRSNLSTWSSPEKQNAVNSYFADEDVPKKPTRPSPPRNVGIIKVR